MVPVVVLMLLAALANAGALVLLRKTALGEPAASSFSLRQRWSLLHRPVWAGDDDDLDRVHTAGSAVDE